MQRQHTARGFPSFGLPRSSYADVLWFIAFFRSLINPLSPFMTAIAVLFLFIYVSGVTVKEHFVTYRYLYLRK